MRVLVKSALNTHSGYGNDAVGLIRALLGLGLEVYVDPTDVTPPLPASVASLLTFERPKTLDLLIHLAGPGKLGLQPADRRSAKITVAWTAHGHSTMDNLTGRSTLRKRLKSYDVVIGYDAVSASALAPYTTYALATLQTGFWPSEWRPVQRNWDSERFGFCMVGPVDRRSDPLVALQAFKELKDSGDFDGAELHLATDTAGPPGFITGLQDWAPGVRVHFNVRPNDVLREFYASQHVLLAPCRGASKDMSALEFLSTGGTVIATNWAGAQQWLSDAYGYPLRYELVADDPATPDCQSARASKAHLKELMLRTYQNREEARRKGETATQLLPDMCGWEAVMNRFFVKLAEHVPGVGERLLHQVRVNKETAQAQQMVVSHV